MEKISLLLLVAKKSLIGSVIVGILGFGGTTTFFNNGSSKNSNKKNERSVHDHPQRPSTPK